MVRKNKGLIIRRVIGAYLLICPIIPLAILDQNAIPTAIAVAALFWTVGLILILKKPKNKGEQEDQVETQDIKEPAFSQVSLSDPSDTPMMQDAQSTADDFWQTTEMKPIKVKKKHTGLIVGLSILGLFMFALVFGVYKETQNPNFGKSELEIALNINEQQSATIEGIFKTCGFDKIDKVTYDAIMDYFADQGIKGYRVATDGLNNVNLYMNPNNTVYQVSYAGHLLYDRGKFVSKISDYVMDMQEKSKWQWRCQETVKQALVAPSSADFPNITEWYMQKSNGKVTVQSYVDAQNSFGAKIRSEFQFIINTKTETIESFIFEGEEMIHK